MGATTFHRLLSEYGSAAAALEALPQVAAAAGVKDYEPASQDETAREIAAGRRLGARLVCLGEPDYPPLLAEIADAPPVLWMLGRRELARRPMVAMVGTRRCSSIGERMARHLAAGLGEAGYAVASGLARGIDACAHEAALPTGTVAVLAGGIDVAYPQENRALQARIAAEGLLLSEQRIGLQPQARHFPPRNRIVSGVARGLIVVEAAARSGSLITARDALDQGREVLAVPGHPFDGRVSGCNMLIRDGATLLRGVEDALEVLGPAADAPAPAEAATPADADVPEVDAASDGPPASRTAATPDASVRAPGHASPTRPSTSPGAGHALPAAGRAVPRKAAPPSRDSARALSLGRQILSRLSVAPLAEDQLIRDLGQPASAVGPALVDLELEGRVIRHPGGLVSLGAEAPPGRAH